MNDDKNVYISAAYTVYINDRRFPEDSSSFANTYKIDKDGTRDEVIQKYKIWVREKLKNDISLQKELISMKGKNLGCWCYPEPCHGNILLELIDEYCAKKSKIIPSYDYFEGKCCICHNKCNELSGWKCEECNNSYCDEHNCEEFLCDC